MGHRLDDYGKELDNEDNISHSGNFPNGKDSLYLAFSHFDIAGIETSVCRFEYIQQGGF